MILTGGSEEARMGLSDLAIDGSALDESTGYMHFKLRGAHRVDALKRSPDGTEEVVNIPIDGFILNPNDGWVLVQWFIQAPEPS